jgi:hypothetical protein|tara:strand:+ start:696 stop:1244 length:549 start_codon:yes stop_codon:yes gene_type:complete
MKVSLNDYVNSPNFSREKRSVFCCSVRISVPISLAAIVDFIEVENRIDVWHRVLTLAKLHSDSKMGKKERLHCLMAFIIQRIIGDYSLNRLLRTDEPWGSTVLKSSNSAHSIQVPNFLFDASEHVFGSSWKKTHASAELDKVVSIIESKNIRVTKTRLSAVFFDKLILSLSSKKYGFIEIDV